MKMNNKILTFAVGILFLCAGTLATSAQKYVDYTKNAQDLAVGDTVVMIDGNPSHYLTGEKIPKWVYQKRHSIMQIGTKRFPDGVLLREIYSWVDLHYMHKPQDVKNEEKQPVVEEVVTVQPEPEVQPVQETVVPQEEVKPEPAEEVGQQPVQEVQPEEEKSEDKPQRPGFSRFSIGVRGGAASLMQQAPEVGSWKIGYNAMLDLQYAYYFARKKNPERATRHGILVDLSAGYTNSPLKADMVDLKPAFTRNFNGQGNADYYISALNLKEHDGQVQVELALMYSLLHKGFFFNIGPKVIMPVFSHSKTTFSSSHIEAYFVDQDVWVRDTWATGRYDSENGDYKGKWKNSKLNLALAADLGYEFQLRNGHALGLGLYADYNFIDFGFKAAEANSGKLFDITPQVWAPAKVDVLPITDSFTQKLNGFDCGVKVIYHFNFPKQF